jgi:hypothetical protein
MLKVQSNPQRRVHYPRHQSRLGLVFENALLDEHYHSQSLILRSSFTNAQDVSPLYGKLFLSWEGHYGNVLCLSGRAPLHCRVQQLQHILLPDNAPSKYTRGFLRAFYSLDCNSNMSILQSDYPNMFDGSIYFWLILFEFAKKDRAIKHWLAVFSFSFSWQIFTKFQPETFQILEDFSWKLTQILQNSRPKMSKATYFYNRF